DPFGLHSEHPPIQASPYEKWPKCYETFTTGASTTDEAKSYLTFTLAVYPNACRDIPPTEGGF
ncbi:MAG: hypothetical protein MUO23_07875, partial [Anaerolineales bacterium]|nr:hypothetical protein [Anaerolineales bacterium]